MNTKEKQIKKLAFSDLVEKKIQGLITKGKDHKVISEPKPKSGKGL